MGWGRGSATGPAEREELRWRRVKKIKKNKKRKGGGFNPGPAERDEKGGKGVYDRMWETETKGWGGGGSGGPVPSGPAWGVLSGRL